MRDSGLLCLLGNEIFFMGSYSECHKTLLFFFFFLTKYILPLQVLCGKTNNNNNKDRSDEKPHFCWINVCGRGLLALRGGWGRQQGSACGDAPHPEVAGRHKACSPRLPGKSRECPTNAPQDGGCSP